MMHLDVSDFPETVIRRETYGRLLSFGLKALKKEPLRFPIHPRSIDSTLVPGYASEISRRFTFESVLGFHEKPMQCRAAAPPPAGRRRTAAQARGDSGGRAARNNISVCAAVPFLSERVRGGSPAWHSRSIAAEPVPSGRDPPSYQ
jgi:hypothetical protein